MIESLGQYRLLDPIGPSPTGDVFRARDTRLGRTVALYVVSEQLAANPEALDRLLQRARAAMALSHPNVATLFDVGTDRGRWFLAFEFVPGAMLRRIANGQPLPVRRAIDLAAQIADALAEGHARGIAHGALGLDSVIVTPNGRAKVIKFGLTSSAPAGPHRAAWTGEDADLFALGAVLYELLAGRVPVGDPGAAGSDEGSTTTAPPSRHNPAVPRELDAVVLRALSTPGGAPTGSAAACAAALRSVESRLPPPALDRALVRPRGAGKVKHPARWLVAAAIVGVAIVSIRGCWEK